MIRFTNTSAIKFEKDTIQFNGGELHPVLSWNYSKETELKTVELFAYITSSKDIMELLLVKDAIDRMIIGKSVSIKLVLPYVPYARQDRVANAGEALGIKVFCDLINQLNFDSVTITDPHSEVAPALLNNVIVVSQAAAFSVIYGRYINTNDIIVAPDLGATKKAKIFAEAYNLPLIYATKTRDTKTGKLSAPKLHYDAISKEEIRNRVQMGGKLVVIDDICDAGGTFVALGALFAQEGLTRSSPGGEYIGAMLLVTHGIFANNAKQRLWMYFSNIQAVYDWEKLC